MQWTNWIILLAIAWLAVIFCCSRHLALRSLADRARHLRGMRLLMQATLAWWAALVTLERSLTSPGGVPFGLDLSPHAALGVALLLAGAGCLWSVRGSRLLRQRRMFGAS